VGGGGALKGLEIDTEEAGSMCRNAPYSTERTTVPASRNGGQVRFLWSKEINVEKGDARRGLPFGIAYRTQEEGGTSGG